MTTDLFGNDLTKTDSFGTPRETAAPLPAAEPTPRPWRVATAFQDANRRLPCTLLDANGKRIVYHQDRKVLQQIVQSVNSFDALKAAVDLFAYVCDSRRADLDADEVLVLEAAIEAINAK